jgi:hypothetical protein
MKTHKKCHSALLCLLLASVIILPRGRADESPAVEIVIVNGSAETRDGALVDACRLAVAKIHGGRVAGILMKTNERSGRFDETRDATELSFDGLLTNYSIKKESQPGIGSKLWKIQIEASVLRSFPDRFSGRIMVRIPSARELVRSGVNEKIAQNITIPIANWFANSRQFALLEREQESAIDDELDRAASNATATREKSRLGGQKTADIAILVEGGSISFNEYSTSFKNTSRQSHTCVADYSMVIKIIDVMTKGEVGREEISISAKKSTSDPQRSRNEAVAAMTDDLTAMLSGVGLQILAHLDCTRLSVNKNGKIDWVSPDHELSMKNFTAVRLFQILDGTNTERNSLGTFKLIDSGGNLSVDQLNDDFPFEEIIQFYPYSTNE